jgi:hypothetical protein
MPDSLLLYWFLLKPDTGISPFPSSPLDLVYSKSFIGICLGDPVVYLVLSLLSKQYQHAPTMLPTRPTSAHRCSSPSTTSTAMVDDLFFSFQCLLRLGAFLLISSTLRGSLSSIRVLLTLSSSLFTMPRLMTDHSTCHPRQSLPFPTSMPSMPSPLPCYCCPMRFHTMLHALDIDSFVSCLPICTSHPSSILVIIPTSPPYCFSLSSMLSPTMPVLSFSYTLVSPDTSRVVPYYCR